MRAAVALSVALSLTTTACFPDNAKHRTIAKITEGGFLIGGIVTLAVVNSGADCDEDGPGLNPNEDCEDRAQLFSNIGLGLILVGLVGFIVTVSTSPDDDARVSPVTLPPPPASSPASTPASFDPLPDPSPAPSSPAPSDAAPSDPASDPTTAPAPSRPPDHWDERRP